VPPPTKKKSFWDKPEAVAILIAGVLGAIGVIVAALIGSGIINATPEGRKRD
jgi:hypothetical protein